MRGDASRYVPKLGKEKRLHREIRCNSHKAKIKAKKSYQRMKKHKLFGPNCVWCGKAHEDWTAYPPPCEPGREAHARMEAMSKESRRAQLNDPIAWPPKPVTRKRWQAHGLDCAIAQGAVALCGYVRVPAGHKYAASHYDDPQVQVHGGLTFGCKAREGGRWFGFDTGHAGDWIQMSDRQGRPYSDIPGRIWTIEDMVAETEKLAEQLQEAK